MGRRAIFLTTTATLVLALGAALWLSRGSHQALFDSPTAKAPTGALRETTAGAGRAITAAQTANTPTATARSSVPSPEPISPPVALPPVQTPVRLIYRSLKQRAEQGEVQAQCRLAFELVRCAQADDLRASARYMATRLQKLGDDAPNRQLIAGSAKRFQGLAQEATHACEGFQPDADEQPWRYVLKAALAGDVPSMVNFAFGMSAGLDPKKPLATLDGWAAYEQYAPQLLQRAVDSGSPEAYSLAAYLSTTGPFGKPILPPDRVQAAAYWLALRSRAAPEYRAQLDADLSRLNLSESERSIASMRAAELSTKLRASGEVDLSHGAQPDMSGRHCER